MKFYLLFLLLLNPTLAKTISLKRLVPNKYLTVEIVLSKGLRVSSNCQKSCLALIHSKQRSLKLKKNSIGLKGHPASEICHKVGGKNIILYDDLKNQYDYCFFTKDQSYINSWDLVK